MGGGACVKFAATVAIVGVLFGTPSAVAADQDELSQACKAPTEFTRLIHPLKRTAQRLAAHEPLTIVAIGSSSTAGAGASSPAASYPSRLADELQRLFPGRDIRVLNRGVNGEEAHDMLARFASSVLAEGPDLVLWQVGTNSVLRDHPLAPASLLIRDGVRQLKSSGADVVLMDPQFAPRVIAKPEAAEMVALISAAAKEANVDLFQRFAVMRYWSDAEHLPFASFLSQDELHLNDWSYGCVAKLLGAAIADAVNRSAFGQSIATSRPSR